MPYSCILHEQLSVMTLYALQHVRQCEVACAGEEPKGSVPASESSE